MSLDVLVRLKAKIFLKINLYWSFPPLAFVRLGLFTIFLIVCLLVTRFIPLHVERLNFASFEVRGQLDWVLTLSVSLECLRTPNVSGGWCQVSGIQ